MEEKKQEPTSNYKRRLTSPPHTTTQEVLCNQGRYVLIITITAAPGHGEICCRCLSVLYTLILKLKFLHL